MFHIKFGYTLRQIGLEPSVCSTSLNSVLGSQVGDSDDSTSQRNLLVTGFALLQAYSDNHKTALYYLQQLKLNWTSKEIHIACCRIRISGKQVYVRLLSSCHIETFNEYTKYFQSDESIFEQGFLSCQITIFILSNL